jgi:hypothetical protein
MYQLYANSVLPGSLTVRLIQQLLKYLSAETDVHHHFLRNAKTGDTLKPHTPETESFGEGKQWTCRCAHTYEGADYHVHIDYFTKIGIGTQLHTLSKVT